MELINITNKRIDAKPRSKYKRYSGGSTIVSGGGGGSMVDTSNFVRLTGQTEQTIEGNVYSTNDIVAYYTSDYNPSFPIASKNALGTVKIGNGIQIAEDGTISVTGGTGGGGDVTTEMFTAHTSNLTIHTTAAEKEKWNKVVTDLSAHTSNLNIHTTADEKTKWNKTVTDLSTHTSNLNIHTTADEKSKFHTHANKSFLDVINQNLAITSDANFNTLKCTNDIVAYATSDFVPSFPIASTSALGTVKIGNGIMIESDGTISVTGSSSGTVNDWGDITGTLSAQTDLWNALNGKSSTAHTHSIYSLTSHTHSNYSITSHTHSYNDLTNKPSLFDGNYNSLSNKPSLFDGNYNSLINKPTIPSYTSQLTNNSGYITGINLSMWNGAAGSTGEKTIGNSGNGSYVNIIEDLKVTQNCTFSKTPSVGGVAVSLSNHSHNYVNKAGDTMSGTLIVQRTDSDYSILRCTNRAGRYIQLTSAPSGGGVIQTNDGVNNNDKLIIQCGQGGGNNSTFWGGNINSTGNITAYSSSDVRLKKNIQPLNNGLHLINQLKPVSFYWNTKAKELDIFKDTDTLQYGLIAQETEKVIPQLVHEQYEDENGTHYKAIDYVKIVPFLIDAVKDLSRQINELKKQIEDNGSIRS